MPEKQHLHGVSEKEQRQYEHIKEDAERSGRYGDRAEEVAARTVMKEHNREASPQGPVELAPNGAGDSASTA